MFQPLCEATITFLKKEKNKITFTEVLAILTHQVVPHFIKLIDNVILFAILFPRDIFFFTLPDWNYCIKSPCAST